MITVSSVWASEKQQDVDTQHETISQIPPLSEIELPATSAQLLVPSPTPSNTPVVEGSIVTITDVKANPTDRGVEVIVDTQHETSSQIPQLSEIELPATSAQLLVQPPTPSNPPVVPGSIVPITGVKANATDKGVEVILETTLGEQLQVTNRSAQNNFIADIPNAQLRLSSGEAFTFRSEKPVEGITEITVTNVDANTVRVTVVGVAALPTVELFNDDAGLVFGVASATIATQPPETPPTEEKPRSETPEETPSAQQDDPIELVVTGERDAYRVPNASTATKTDTPLRDIPQSIQVVPRRVLEDQSVTRLDEAIRNVPGVLNTFPPNFANGSFLTIRGFETRDDQGNVLRNGLQDFIGARQIDFSHIQQVEVLKGPASVLFGRGVPGGTVNLITKQPLSNPFYEISATIGNYDFYRGTVDLSGPLNDSKTILYRLNAAYHNIGSFTDFRESERVFVAPVVSFAIGDRTKLTVEGEYSSSENGDDLGLPAVGTVLPNPNGRIPLNRTVTEPFAKPFDVDLYRIGYTLEHQFSDSLSLRNAFRVSSFNAAQEQIFGSSLEPDNRTLNRNFNSRTFDQTSYNFAADLIGKFSTGSIQHEVVFGVDLGRFDSSFTNTGRAIVPLDVFNPVYGQPLGDVTSIFVDGFVTDALGIYIQDQITLTENLKLLLGGRFDTFKRTDNDFLTNTETSTSGDAFSPRVGIVYQPIQPISLYASYSRSFTPVTDIAADGSTFQPERGTQYEVGIKADLNNRLSTTLALFDLTRSNVLTTDPNDPSLSIQTGEQRSRGIELNVAGEILPGWNIFAGYAYTDARITKDNALPIGNRLLAPENSFNLWTTYEIQQGSLQGFGAGLGFFFVGERQGDLDNSFQLPSYFRTDASIFYRREQFRAALNIRNLFNVDYFESAFSDTFVFPGEPFTVQGTISWQF